MGAPLTIGRTLLPDGGTTTLFTTAEMGCMITGGSLAAIALATKDFAGTDFDFDATDLDTTGLATTGATAGAGAAAGMATGKTSVFNDTFICFLTAAFGFDVANVFLPKMSCRSLIPR